MTTSANYQIRTVAAVLLTTAVLGCGDAVEQSLTHNSSEVHSATAAKYVLTSEPAGAVGVIKARAAAKDDQAVVVVGCTGAGEGAWIEGRSAFVLVDSSAALACADEGCEEGCTCHAEELADASTMVKFLDDQGRVLPVDSRQLLGLEEQQTVVVQGRAKRDSDGNLTVMANGIYVRR